jgi:signal transduction histidine kinase
VLANPGPFNGEIDDFSFDKWIEHQEGFKSIYDSLAAYKEFAQNQVGIKIYRDGFAIKPFGFKENDWLKLSHLQTSGRSFYLLRPANVIGYFAISEGLNPRLKDKTDREGFLRSAYSNNFIQLSSFIIKEINSFINIVRRTYGDFIKEYYQSNNKIKTLTESYHAIRTTAEKTKAAKPVYNSAVVRLNDLKTKTQNFVTKVENSPLVSSEREQQEEDFLKTLITNIEDIEKTLLSLNIVIDDASMLAQTLDIIQPKIQLLEEQIFNFSELAGLGLISEALSHEIAIIADKLSNQAERVFKKVESEDIQKSDIYVLIEYIKSAVNGLHLQLKHLDPTLKYLREKKESFSVNDYFESQKIFYNSRFTKVKIKYSIDIFEDFSIRINRGKFTQIIDNIVFNSEYWLRERTKKEKDFKPEFHVLIEKPWLKIFDNGFGINPSVEQDIFEPFVTTKVNGRGLGLFIVQQLLDSSGCFISLLPENNEHSRKYIFGINLTNIIKDG